MWPEMLYLRLQLQRIYHLSSLRCPRCIIESRISSQLRQFVHMDGLSHTLPNQDLAISPERYELPPIQYSVEKLRLNAHHWCTAGQQTEMPPSEFQKRCTFHLWESFHFQEDLAYSVQLLCRTFYLWAVHYVDLAVRKSDSPQAHDE